MYHVICIPLLYSTHMQDLKDITQDVHYENFRKKKLLQGGGGRWVIYPQGWAGPDTCYAMIYSGHTEEVDMGPMPTGGIQDEMRKKEKEVRGWGCIVWLWQQHP